MQLSGAVQDELVGLLLESGIQINSFPQVSMWIRMQYLAFDNEDVAFIIMEAENRKNR